MMVARVRTNLGSLVSLTLDYKKKYSQECSKLMKTRLRTYGYPIVEVLVTIGIVCDESSEFLDLITAEAGAASASHGAAIALRRWRRGTGL